MSDRIFGYILMMLTLTISLGAAYAFWETYRAPHSTRTLRFSEVGTLAVQDPVRMEGTYIGEITGFDLDDSGRVLVHIRSKEPIPVRTSSYIGVKVRGVMGERFIEISTGNLGDPLIPKDEIIDGNFEMGPSEVIAYMDRLSDKIIELRDIMLWLRDGRDDGKRPFVIAFGDMVNIIDTLVLKTFAFLNDKEIGISAGLDTAARLVEDVIRITAEVGTKAPELMDDLTSLIVKVDNLATKVDTLLVRLEPMVAGIDENKYLWGDHLERVQKHLPVIREHLDWVREEGLPLRLRLKFR
ncbi:MAG: MlaD family protein [Chitinispirillales bacterium]|nr:MlaD family protein [Chitinispirillales bacterium]